MATYLIKVPYLQVFEQHHKTAARYFPLGIGYMSSYMKSRGLDVTLFDPEIQGISDDEMVAIIARDKPTIVGLSSATPSFSRACRMAQKIRDASDCVIVFGGVHASTFPEQTLEYNPQFDVTAFGEGEQTMAELAEVIHAHGLDADALRTVNGICFREGDQIVRTADRALIEDIDSLPYPDRDSVPLDLYRATGHIGVTAHVANMVTSRGCPARCTFCESFLTMGYRFREHSPEYVVGEMRMLKERFGVEQIVFNDDTFTMNVPRARAICQAIIDAKLDIQWFCFARVTCGKDPDLLELMRDAGCIHINLGVETGDPTILKRIKKGTTLAQARTTFKRCRELGIKTSAGFIFGFPGESLATIATTVDFAIEISPDVAFFNILVPFPGTEVWGDFPELHGREHDPAFWDNFKTASAGGLPLIELPGLSRQQLKNAVIQANLRYYTRPRFLWRQLRNVRNAYELKANVVGAVELLQRNLRNLVRQAPV
ncbi:MAG: anaerobic magnesium-protoporphyrin IX monomethyl ester cyclase [Myxococcota bacterium]|jgi:anaerobic magnesium-protoporphyrin IX monomethyl ester cyclase